MKQSFTSYEYFGLKSVFLVLFEEYVKDNFVPDPQIILFYQSLYVSKSGDKVKPIRRSNIRRVCWALTESISSSVGCFSDSIIAFFVISVNLIRFFSLKLSPSIFPQCQAIASPSLSSSVANIILSAC